MHEPGRVSRRTKSVRVRCPSLLQMESSSSVNSINFAVSEKMLGDMIFHKKSTLRRSFEGYII